MKTFEVYSVAKMKEDAYIAQDALDAIRMEVKSGHVSPRYLMEKATTVKNCMDFILNECREAMRDE